MSLWAGAAAAEPRLIAWSLAATAAVPPAAGYVEETYRLGGAAPLILRRPVQPERFSGTVQLELGAAALTWQRGGAHLTGNGDVWVGLAVPAGADGDRLLAEAAWLLRSPQGPLGALGFVAHASRLQGVFRVIASGWGEAGCRLADFAEQGHAAARRPNGRPVLDGYFIGSCRRDRPLVVPADAPMIELVAETGWTGVAGRQPDGDEPGKKRFRRYELAGVADVPCAGLPAGALAPISRALLADLDRWLRSGYPPPPSQPFQLAPDGAIARDEHGHAQGGMRPHWVEVPASVQRGCAAEAPLPKSTIARLYPDRAAYLAAVARHLDRQIDERTLLFADAKAELDRLSRN